MLVKFVYLRNSCIKSWRSSMRGRKKPIWRNHLNRKFTLARTVFQGPETLPANCEDLLKSCFRSRLKTSLQSLGHSTTEGGDFWQPSRAGSWEWWRSSAMASSTDKAPNQPHRQDLPSSTFNLEFSLLRHVQLYAVLQNITHKAIICPSPTGSSGILLCSWIFFRSHSQLQFPHLPVCQLLPSRSHYLCHAKNH